jgi:hypothetical protein
MALLASKQWHVINVPPPPVRRRNARVAREESDREDILREATGLSDRVELRCQGCAEPIVCGFRRQGALSLFMGQDEVYQFDSRSALRRGYWQGRLLKAEAGQLVELTRQRTEEATWLLRHELSPAQQLDHLQRLQARIQWLRGALQRGDYQVVGEVRGSGQSVVARLRAWLDAYPNRALVAQTPRVR